MDGKIIQENNNVNFKETNESKEEQVKNKLELLEQIDTMIYNHKVEIEKLKKDKVKLYKYIWENCEHKWEIDNSEYDPITKKYCIKCKLWNSKYLYI